MKWNHVIKTGAVVALTTSLFAQPVDAFETSKIKIEKRAADSYQTQPSTTSVVVEMLPSASNAKIQKMSTKSLETPNAEKFLSIPVPEGKTMEEFIAELEAQSGVQSVEPNIKATKMYRTNDPAIPYYQSHHSVIGTPTAWDKTRGSGVIVAVLDAGFDEMHEDLYENIILDAWTVEYPDYDQHGTHVAGIIGATVNNGLGGAGVAPEVSLITVDVFEDEGADLYDVLEGIYGVVEAGADIINMSLGFSDYSPLLEEATTYAHDMGLVLVAAAGNSATDAPDYPSALPGVISVGATDDNDNLAEFSDYGPDIDIVAPGVEILSTLVGDDYGFMDGTSMAAPVVSGVAALVKANDPTLTNIEIEEILYKSAKDLGAKGKDQYFGNGRVDAANAVRFNSTGYTDLTPSYWATDEIKFLAGQSIITGFNDGSFRPHQNTTRAEAAKMLAIALDLTVVDGPSMYSDVSSGYWGNKYISAVTQAGLFSGVAGKFNPGKNITRAEMAKVLSKAFKYEDSPMIYFNDIRPTYWARPYIAGLYENNITLGYPDNTFRPGLPTSRAHFSAFLARALDPAFRE